MRKLVMINRKAEQKLFPHIYKLSPASAGSGKKSERKKVGIAEKVQLFSSLSYLSHLFVRNPKKQSLMFC